MWNAGQGNYMNSFLMFACLGPFYAEQTARSHELDITPNEVAFTVKGLRFKVVGETKFHLCRNEEKEAVNNAHVMA